jgi:hypothetical protein
MVIVLLGAGVWAYFYFAASPKLAVTDTPSLPASGATLPGTAGGDANSEPAFTPSAARITTRLTRISTGPVVPGTVAIDRPAGTASSTADVEVRYIEQRSGNVYTYLVKAGQLTRISNRTLPGIADAKWLPTGETAFVRYLSGDTLSTVSTYGLAADGSGGFFLPQDLADLDVSATNVLALASGASGSIASRLATDGSGGGAVFSSPLSSLRAAFAGTAGYIAFTKPAASLAGYLFAVSAQGRFSRIAGPLHGLVALPDHAGRYALVSSVDNDVMRLTLTSLADGSEIPLPVGTIADKCAWTADDRAIYCAVPVSPSTDYSYPDDWYQGAAHFSDRIWKIDVAGRFAQLVLDLRTAVTDPVDASALALDPDATTLVFSNKNDGSLWSFQL